MNQDTSNRDSTSPAGHTNGRPNSEPAETPMMTPETQAVMAPTWVSQSKIWLHVGSSPLDPLDVERPTGLRSCSTPSSMLVNPG